MFGIREIYIPIWWYSNLGDERAVKIQGAFTFQSGDI